jgi:hypothetical protein
VCWADGIWGMELWAQVCRPCRVNRSYDPDGPRRLMCVKISRRSDSERSPKKHSSAAVMTRHCGVPLMTLSACSFALVSGGFSG